MRSRNAGENKGARATKARSSGGASSAEIRARLKLVDRAFGTVSAHDYDHLARRATWYAERYDKALTLLARAASAMMLCSHGHKAIRNEIVLFMERTRKETK